MPTGRTLATLALAASTIQLGAALTMREARRQAEDRVLVAAEKVCDRYETFTVKVWADQEAFRSQRLVLQSDEVDLERCLAGEIRRATGTDGRPAAYQITLLVRRCEDWGPGLMTPRRYRIVGQAEAIEPVGVLTETH